MAAGVVDKQIPDGQVFDSHIGNDGGISRGIHIGNGNVAHFAHPAQSIHITLVVAEFTNFDTGGGALAVVDFNGGIGGAGVYNVVNGNVIDLIPEMTQQPDHGTVVTEASDVLNGYVVNVGR